jgi:4-hydroxy-tetrahydrodipicolinate synthase
MARKNYQPHGVIPAVLLPFHEDLSIDEPSFRAHLRDVAGVRGISAITINAHSTEVGSCTFEEQKRVLAITQDEIGDRLPIVHGIYAEGSLEAQRLAKMADEGGASALLVFPSGIYTMGQRPEMAIEHFKRIADVTDLPLIVFQYAGTSQQHYPLPTLMKMIDAVPSIAAIKDWSGTAQLADRQLRALHARTPPVNVLSTHSAWLFPSLVLGCKGLLSGSGSVIADLQVQLFEAVQAKNLALAQQIHDRIYHTAEVFYTDPFVDMHNRMKEALVLLGKLPRAVVRPPLVKIPAPEIERIRQALIAAGLLPSDRQ